MRENWLMPAQNSVTLKMVVYETIQNQLRGVQEIHTSSNHVYISYLNLDAGSQVLKICQTLNKAMCIKQLRVSKVFVVL